MSIKRELATKLYQSWCDKERVHMRPSRIHALEAIASLGDATSFAIEEFLKSWKLSPIKSKPSAYRILGELVASGVLVQIEKESVGRVWSFTEQVKGGDCE